LRRVLDTSSNHSAITKFRGIKSVGKMAECGLTDMVYTDSSDEQLLLPSLKVKVKISVKVILEQSTKFQTVRRGIIII